MLETPLLKARQLCARLEGLKAEDLDSATLYSLRAGLADLSDAIGERYFLQQKVPGTKIGLSFLA